MPDLPTIAEAGLPGYANGGSRWWSAAPTPRPIIDKLNGILMPYLKRRREDRQRAGDHAVPARPKAGKIYPDQNRKVAKSGKDPASSRSIVSSGMSRRAGTGYSTPRHSTITCA